jgi:hypothetical protein
MNDISATSTAITSLETGLNSIDSNSFGNPEGHSLTIQDGSGFELGHGELANLDTPVLGCSSLPIDVHTHCGSEKL